MKKAIITSVIAIAVTAGIVWATAQPEPSVGLYWVSNADPTIGPVEVPGLAHRDRDRERFHLGIGCRDDREVFDAARNPRRDVRLRQPVVPLRGRGRWPHHL